VTTSDAAAAPGPASDVAAEQAALPVGTDQPPTAVLESLTDEELAVLSLSDGVPVTPYLSSVEPRERTPLLRTAYRGLVARGIVDPPTAEARRRAREEAADAAGTDARPHESGGARDPSQPDPVVGIDLQVREDVRTLVTLRRAARAVVAMARTTALLQDYVYVHVVEDVALLEEVSSDGVHRFALRGLADLGETVLAAALHPQAGDAEGEPATVTSAAADDPSPPDDVLAAAGQALVRCDLTVLTPDEPAPTMLGLFTAPAGSWLFETPRGAGRPIVARPLAAEELREAVRDALRPTGWEAQ
jgi:hypothetical protein